jgi:hypothetical protein
LELRFFAARAVELEAQEVGAEVGPLLEMPVGEGLSADVVGRAEELAHLLGSGARAQFGEEVLALFGGKGLVGRRGAGVAGANEDEPEDEEQRTNARRHGVASKGKGGGR